MASTLAGAVLSAKDLILMVQGKPMLWDRHSKLYRDKTSKEKAWEDICTEIEPEFPKLKTTAQETILTRVMKKWYNVRDSYRKSLRNKNGDRTKRYLYSDLLTFLDPMLEAIDKDNTIEPDEKFERDSNADTSEQFENEVYFDFEETDAAPTPKKVKLEETKVNEETDDNIVAVLANLIQREEDEDRSFFKSITPQVKTLSDDMKFEFRIQVMNLLKNLKKKDSRLKSMNMKIERVSSESDS